MTNQKAKVLDRVAQLLKISTREVTLLIETRIKMSPPSKRTQEIEARFIEEILYQTQDRGLDFAWFQYQLKSQNKENKKVA